MQRNNNANVNIRLPFVLKKEAFLQAEKDGKGLSDIIRYFLQLYAKGRIKLDESEV